MNKNSLSYQSLDISTNHNVGWTNWCSFDCGTNNHNGDYPVDDTEQPLYLLKPNTREIEVLPNSSKKDSDRIALEIRDNDQYTPVPPSAPNGGLYGGPQSTRPWGNIPTPPTVTYLINKNLKSANPPPGATEQYPGGNRLGNNYQPMPGVYWYNPDNKHAQYMIKGT